MCGSTDCMMSCCGSVDKTTDSRPWGPRFESTGSGSSALGQCTIYTHCLVPRNGLKAVVPLVAFVSFTAFLYNFYICHIPVCLFVCLFVCLSAYLFACLSVYLFQSVRRSELEKVQKPGVDPAFSFREGAIDYARARISQARNPMSLTAGVYIRSA